MHCEMDHIALNVDDTETMIAFYTTLIGLEPERLDEYHDGRVAFPSVRLNADTVIDLFPPSMWQGGDTAHRAASAMNHFCLSMDKTDWETLRLRLNDAGIAVEEGPDPRWGAHGTGTSIYFRDPESNLIEARYYGDL